MHEHTVDGLRGPGGRAAATSTGPFGGPQTRSRFTDAVWQGPTWSFAILVGVLGLAGDAGGLDRAWFAAGFAVVMAATLVALVVRWDRRAVWVQPLVPLLDLLGAGVMVAADPAHAESTMLLCALPVVWLAFEFGRWGLLAGALGTVGAGLGSSVVPTSPVAAADVVLSTVFVLGVGVVARMMSEVLRRVGEELVAQKADADDARTRTAEQLAVMRGVMASIDVAVMVWQGEGELLLNDQARTMMARGGSSPTDPSAGGPRVFTDDGSALVPPAAQAIARAVAGEEFHGVVERVGHPGDQRVVVASARQFARPGATRGVSVLAAWDATDLMDAIRVREQFVSTVSHELRTPLTAIIASMEVLTATLSDLVPAPTDAAADVGRLTSAISRNAGVLEARIDELLHSGSSHDTLRPQRTDVVTLVRAALRKHESAVARARVRLDQRLDSGRRYAELDPVRFEQVVDNVVSNAIKYTDAGGTITAQLVVDDDHVVFAVADSGIGMAPDEQRQVFDRFYRAPRARAEAVQGLGIGLSLVKSIVDWHRGHIELRSSPGRGTTVTITLPASTRPRATEGSAQEPST